MKKLLFFAAGIAVMLSSCNNEQLPQEITDCSKVYASFSQDDDTKVSLGESDGTKTPLNWNQGDKIAVINTADFSYGMYQTSSSVQDGDAKAVFDFKSGTQIDPEDNHLAAYPYDRIEDETFSFRYNTEQDYTEGSIEIGAMPLVAVNAGGNDFIFNAQASVLRLQLSTPASDVTVSGIEITSQSKALSGLAAPDLATYTFGVPSGEGAGKTVSLVCASPVSINGTAKDFNIVMPSQEYPAGDLTITIHTNLGDITSASKKAVTFAAGHIYNTSVNVVPDVLYLAGGGFEKYNNDWGLVTACPLMPQGNGVYATAEKVYLNKWCYFRIASADYSRDYSRVDGAGNYWTAQPKSSDNDKPFIPGYANGSWADGYYTVSIDLNTMIVTCSSDSDIDPAVAFYVYGQNFTDGYEAWTFSDDHALMPVSSGIYKSVKPIFLNKWCYFKFEKQDWTEYVRDPDASNYWTVAAKGTKPDGGFVPGDYDSSFKDGEYEITLNLNTLEVTIAPAGVLVDPEVAFYVYGGGFDAEHSDWTFHNDFALMPTSSGVYESVKPIYILEWSYFKFDKQDWTEYVRDAAAGDYWTVTPRVKEPTDNDETFSIGNKGYKDGYYNVKLDLNTLKVTITPAE